jgi:tetratricopeptide (TPR) repeat protein
MMKRTVMAVMLVAGLLIAAAPSGRAFSFADPSAAGNPDAARAAEEKADLARAHDNYAAAEVYYQIALRADRQNPSLYNKLGIVQLQLHSRRAARKNFQTALKYDPKNVSAINNLGAVALMDKKYRPAVAYFKQALTLDESSAATHVNLAEAWLGLKEIDHAMTEYARALEIDGDVLNNSMNGSMVLLSTPAQRARIDYLIAKSYMKRGNLDGALDYLTRARNLHYPDLAKVYSDQDFAPLWKDPRLAKIITPIVKQ